MGPFTWGRGQWEAAPHSTVKGKATALDTVLSGPRAEAELANSRAVTEPVQVNSPLHTDHPQTASDLTEAAKGIVI